jgi:hypothetical protein
MRVFVLEESLPNPALLPIKHDLHKEVPAKLDQEFFAVQRQPFQFQLLEFEIVLENIQGYFPLFSSKYL